MPKKMRLAQFLQGKPTIEVMLTYVSRGITSRRLFIKDKNTDLRLRGIIDSVTSLKVLARIDLIAELHGKQMFSHIYFVKAFHQIPINPANVLETAIRNPFSPFESLWMQFGLCNASSTFQCFIDEMTRNLPFVYDFVDDLLVHPKMKQRTQNT
ncbi:transposon Tf2-9 polyprotein [Nephila pilipes]|uniref:Transposon Tf2-9 polyprotein n=1 Tax=Nephila pilipes TaxID=299642 RepID=A0A8X6PTT0_NEPPI|nr:transposon Tf2-9 polyprotein [Nephila pilipes]